MTDTLTYKQITDRCDSMAREIAPEFPTANTIEAWESYVEDLSNIEDEFFDLVFESVESTDWAIYTHYGHKILDTLPQSDINDAENSFLEFNGDLTLNESCGGCFDVYSIQSQIAFFALLNLTQDSLFSLIRELKELAETQIENLEE